MIDKLFLTDTGQLSPPKEGDFYKEVTVGGRSFRLHYGYYEEFERESPFNDPMPIYPDFIKKPVFTENGIPIVTAIQDICQSYHGRSEGDSCTDCIFFQKEEELFGLCSCPDNHNLIKNPQGGSLE